MKPAKHIGIVAVSAEGAALCYPPIFAQGAALLGPHDHPQLTIHTYPHADHLRHVGAAHLRSSRRYFGELISKFGRRGCEAVVLGCTEIPLLVGEQDSPLPTLDSTRILARAALRDALTGS